MTSQELENRIKAGEDVRTELKNEHAHPDALAATIVSFANRSEGGSLILGVEDDKTITGVTNPDGLILTLTNICRQNVEPPLTTPDIGRHWLGDKLVLVVAVSKGPERPYRTNKGVYHVREGASKRTATRQELFELYQAAGVLHPDEMPIENASMEDLDLAYLKEVRPEIAELPPDEMRRTLTNIRVLSEEGYPTLAGMVCFGREVQRFCPHARITAIRIAGNDASGDLTDRMEITGVLQRQIHEAQEFARKQIEAAERTKVIPIYSFPLEAINEAIVNAIAHRDYLAPAQVRLFIFDDRIEVISPGLLLNSVTIEQMRLGCHTLRNTVIFAHLARLELAIQAGLGVPRMISLMRGRRLSEPQIVLTKLDLRVTFSL